MDGATEHPRPQDARGELIHHQEQHSGLHGGSRALERGQGHTGDQTHDCADVGHKLRDTSERRQQRRILHVQQSQPDPQGEADSHPHDDLPSHQPRQRPVHLLQERCRVPMVGARNEPESRFLQVVCIRKEQDADDQRQRTCAQQRGEREHERQGPLRQTLPQITEAVAGFPHKLIEQRARVCRQQRQIFGRRTGRPLLQMLRVFGQIRGQPPGIADGGPHSHDPDDDERADNGEIGKGDPQRAELALAAAEYVHQGGNRVCDPSGSDEQQQHETETVQEPQDEGGNENPRHQPRRPGEHVRATLHTLSLALLPSRPYGACRRRRA